jgi:hypothetical protein
MIKRIGAIGGVGATDRVIVERIETGASVPEAFGGVHESTRTDRRILHTGGVAQKSIETDSRVLETIDVAQERILAQDGVIAR